MLDTSSSRKGEDRRAAFVLNWKLFGGVGRQESPPEKCVLGLVFIRPEYSRGRGLGVTGGGEVRDLGPKLVQRWGLTEKVWNRVIAKSFRAGLGSQARG